jgi:hypothetical protein
MEVRSNLLGRALDSPHTTITMAKKSTTKKKTAPKKSNRKEDRSYKVLSHRSTIGTDPYSYQVVLLCEVLGKVVLTPKSPAKFTALVALLTAGIQVYYWPAMSKVGINSKEP